MAKRTAQAKPNALLRAERLRNGWTQQDVADHIGAPLALNVTRWERGTSIPSMHYVARLCQLFGKTPQELGLLPEEQSTDEIAPAPSTYWSVPYRRNPYFTGRDAILTELHEQLNATHTVALNQSYAISGLGGIGKTQIAVEYSYRYKQDYQAIFWIRAASRETLIADFVHLASSLQLPGADSQDQLHIVEGVKRWLSQQRGWLLILDNADDLALLTDFLPTGNTGHLLLTTRAAATGRIAPCLIVERMDQDEGCLLLLRRANLIAHTTPLDKVPAAMLAQAQELVKALDGLPLALDQAAAYIEETGCSLTDYLELYQYHRKDLLQWQGTDVSAYPHSVANTWSLSFQRVEEAEPAAADLLRLCAFLDPDAISEQMLTEGATVLDAPLQTSLSDAFRLNWIIAVLRRFSLVQRDAQARTLSLHRLVQAVLKDRMDESMRRRWAERTVRAVSAAFPEIEFSTWLLCEQCLPHASSCAALIEQYQLISPEAGHLFTYAGHYLSERGLYEHAESYLVQALSMREQLLGPDHPDTITTLVHLGELRRDQGQYMQAQSHLQRALAIREQALGPDHLDVATVLHLLGNTCMFVEQYEAAESLLQRALLILERVLGPEHPETATVVVALAQNNLRRSRYVAAEKLFLRALSIYENTHGLEHPDTTSLLNTMGILYCYQGRYEQARSYLYRALLCNERLRGPEHPETATNMDNLGLVYLKQGDLEEAAALYQRALPIHEKSQGPEHPYTGGVLSSLGHIYSLQGKYDQAEPLHLRSLAIYEKAVGKESVDVAITLRSLAHHYYLCQKYYQAEQSCQHALSIFERTLDPDNARSATALHLLARICQAQSRYQEALSLYQRAVAMCERVLGPEHTETIAASKNYTALTKKCQKDQ